MSNRDQQILDSLLKFRVLDRDALVAMHFKDVKNGINQANAVMRRLRRDGRVLCDTSARPYLYFPVELGRGKGVTAGSQKIPHFLAIARLYLELEQEGELERFEVEPRYGEQFMQPDVFCIWKATPFFIEVQRSVYSRAVMREKLSRYLEYYYSNEWKDEPWQRGEGREVFPYIWILTETKYNVLMPRLKVIQTKDVAEFVSTVR